MASPRDRGCCSVNFVKSALYVFNVIFLASGLGVLFIALWTIFDKYEYVALLSTETYHILTYFLLSAGALVLFVSFLGCFALCYENRAAILIYVFLLLLIFLMEAMVGILAYMYEENVQTELAMNLNETLVTTYEEDSDKTEAIEFLQQKFRCCGAYNYSDWKYSKWQQSIPPPLNKVPDSCCKTVSINCGRRDHPSNINYEGCMDKMEQHLKDHLGIMSAVGLGICTLQIFGIVLGCMLYIKLKKLSRESDSPSENALLHQ